MGFVISGGGFIAPLLLYSQTGAKRLQAVVNHGWLMKNPTYSFCGRLGRAAARPYHIGPGRDALPRVRGALDGFMNQP